MSDIEITYSQSDQVNELVGALAKAKLKYGEIVKSKTNKYTGSMYADLQDLMNAAERPLAEEGLVIVHFPIERIDQKKAGALTKLIHTSGQFFGNQFLMPATGKAQGGGEKLDAQTVTGGVTYAKRCNYGALAGLVGEVDEDGNELADKSADNAVNVPKTTTIAAPPVSKARAKQSQDPRPNDPVRTTSKSLPNTLPDTQTASQTHDSEPPAPVGPPKADISGDIKPPISEATPGESNTSPTPEPDKQAAKTQMPNKTQFDAYIARVRDEIKPALEKAGLQPTSNTPTGTRLKQYILVKFGNKAKELTDLSLEQWEQFLNYYETMNNNAAIVAEIEKGAKS